MGLSGDQVKLVQSSWEVVKTKGDFEAHGLTLFERLFTQHPDMYGVFPFAKGMSSWDELRGTPTMKRHAAGVVRAVDGAVTGLADLSAVSPKLEALGAEHAKRNLKPEYFDAVGEALLFTLQGGLGDGWSPETQDAWKVVYGIITEAMQKGINQAK